MCPTTTQEQNQNQSLEILAEELRKKLQSTTDPILVFDIGDKDRFKREHIPGSKFTVFDEETVKTLLPQLPIGIDIILVGEDEKYLYDMAKLGKEKGTLNIRYLKGGLAAWKWNTKEEEEPRISSYNLKRQGLDNDSIKQGRIFLLDVRTPDEFKEWNIEGSHNIPMAKVPQSLGQIPKNKEIITICPHGNRSSMVTLMLQRLGYNVKTLERGLKSWSSAFEYTSKVFDIINSTLSNPKVRIVQIRRIGKGCISYIIGQEENRQGKEVYNYANNSNNNDDNRKEIIVIDTVFIAEEYMIIANKDIDLSSNNITKVLDTHLHADHVSAARDLASKTNAKLYLSSYEDYLFTKEEETQQQKETEKKRSLLRENDMIDIGSKETQQLAIRVIHTPGHTAGGLSFLLGDNVLFTGDTLFINSIGRPDLKDKAKEFANMLYDTLHNKIFNFTNKEDVLVFPTHMEGNVREEEFVTDSLENIEERSKYLKLTRDDFVKKMVSVTMPTPPQYKHIISMNRGDKALPLSISEIHDIEMGPNRCSVSG